MLPEGFPFHQFNIYIVYNIICLNISSIYIMLFSLSSESVSRLHEFLGRRLFLFPCGFQRRAWRVVLDGGFLRVCQIQRHFLCLIWTSIGCRLVLLHRSSLQTFSGHLMLRRQALKKVCIFFMDASVVLHVSDPYNSTDLTFEFRIRNLVEIRISFDAQMFLSMMKADLALPILDLMSLSVPPCLSTVLPR